jgi:hypothetical protein
MLQASHSQSFQLLPFNPPAPPAINLTGQIQRHGSQLQIHYELTGPWQQVQIPPPQPAPTRQYGLWETTCFEFFLGRPGDLSYWEFNLSPNGNWNVYQLENYRQGLAVCAAVTTLPLQVNAAPSRFTLSASVDLAPLVEDKQPLELSVTAVLALLSGETSYWAIAHTGPEADFHRRDSFVLNL